MVADHAKDEEFIVFFILLVGSSTGEANLAERLGAGRMVIDTLEQAHT